MHKFKLLVVLICLVSYSRNLYGQIDQTNIPHPLGKLIDGGGHLLHLNVMGGSMNGPTVILENGSFDFSFIWSLVQPEVAKFSKVVSYDRAGYAWSESGPIPRTSRQIVYELHTALKNDGINGPYIVVGQSFGGFLVRAFARYYPNEVVGMVLVDVLNEDSKVRMGNQMTRIRELAQGRELPTIKRESNIARANQSDSVIINGHLEPPLNKLPLDIQRLQIWAQSQKSFIEAGKNEMDWSPEDVADMYANRGKKEYMLGDMPLIVICRGHGGYEGFSNANELEKERLSLQNELAHLSTKGKLVIDKRSGHNIHLEDPQAVIDAIKEVVKASGEKKKRH